MDRDPSSQAELYSYFTSFHPRYELLAAYLSGALRSLLARSEIDTDQVSARPKTVTSSMEKVQRKGYRSASQVHDLCGVRVVVRHLDDVDAVRELIKNEFLVEDEIGHGAASADIFGYSGFHMIIKLSTARAKLIENEPFENLRAEVQIRTILQHAWASISHSLDYKSETEAPQDVRRSLHRIAAILEAGDVLFQNYKDQVEYLRSLHPLSTPPLHDDLLEQLNFQIPEEAWDNLEQLAFQAGWPASAKLRAARSLSASHKQALERLIIAAAECGVSVVRDLPRCLEDVTLDSLSQIGAAGEINGYRPYAIGPDILSLWLIREKREFPPEAFERLGDAFRPELLAAALA